MTSAQGLSGATVLVLAVAAGGAVANNYAITPAVATIAQDLGSTSQA